MKTINNEQHACFRFCSFHKDCARHSASTLPLVSRHTAVVTNHKINVAQQQRLLRLIYSTQARLNINSSSSCFELDAHVSITESKRVRPRKILSNFVVLQPEEFRQSEECVLNQRAGSVAVLTLRGVSTIVFPPPIAPSTPTSFPLPVISKGSRMSVRFIYSEMAMAIYVEMSGDLYSFRWIDSESRLNAFVTVLERDTGYGAKVQISLSGARAQRRPRQPHY